ncbi:MAG TPA: lipid-A-disaccharide synthase [Phycisphaerae bacterium]|nr:lipid-A-disaccharide synthase [Phycisphaerae bacterium]
MTADDKNISDISKSSKKNHEKASPVIFMSAAEASGDHHAAELIRRLREKYPAAEFIGAAGPCMAAEGCEVIADLTHKASMLGGPVTGVFYYMKKVRQLCRAMTAVKPDIFVPVDSPALNWHLAKQARRCGVPVMYYVAPQVWAWAPWRIKKVRRLTDHVACLLPFEENYFRSRGVAATYVGHPLFDQLPPQHSADECPDFAIPWTSGEWKIAFLPGSRPSEIRLHAKMMSRIADGIRRTYPLARCKFTAVGPREADMIKKYSRRDDLDIAVARTPEVLAESHYAVAASGTVTLEVAHFGVPMAVVYHIGLPERILYKLFIRHLIRTQYLSLVNIIAQKQLVPEFMPVGPDVKSITACVLDALGDYGYLLETRRAMLELTAGLCTANPRGANANIADIISTILERYS